MDEVKGRITQLFQIAFDEFEFHLADGYGIEIFFQIRQQSILVHQLGQVIVAYLPDIGNDRFVGYGRIYFVLHRVGRNYKEKGNRLVFCVQKD